MLLKDSVIIHPFVLTHLLYYYFGKLPKNWQLYRNIFEQFMIVFTPLFQQKILIEIWRVLIQTSTSKLKGQLPILVNFEFVDNNFIFIILVRTYMHEGKMEFCFIKHRHSLKVCAFQGSGVIITDILMLFERLKLIIKITTD